MIFDLEMLLSFRDNLSRHDMAVTLTFSIVWAGQRNCLERLHQLSGFNYSNKFIQTCPLITWKSRAVSCIRYQNGTSVIPSRGKVELLLLLSRYIERYSVEEPKLVTAAEGLHLESAFNLTYFVLTSAVRYGETEGL